MELYKKYRPKGLKDVIGQDVAVRVLQKYLDKENMPHFICLVGPSGCGKTTIMRILRKKLNCSIHDFYETNGASNNGVDTVRSIQSRMHQAPIDGKCKIYAINEVHKLTNEAQNAFLETLEDTPKHVYFIFTTTTPNKLLAAVKTRATEIMLNSLNNNAIKHIIDNVANSEKKRIKESVLDKIVEYSSGSARKALVFLDQIIELDDEDDMLNAIEKSSSEDVGFQIAKALHNPRIRWSEMIDILNKIENEEVETIRYIVLGFAKSVMLKGGKLTDRAMLIINAFGNNFYDSKQAGLVAACYEVIGLTK